MVGRFLQALELLIVLANQNLGLMAAVEQQKLERQQLQKQRNISIGLGAVTGAGVDLRWERSAACSCCDEPG